MKLSGYKENYKAAIILLVALIYIPILMATDFTIANKKNKKIDCMLHTNKSIESSELQSIEQTKKGNTITVITPSANHEGVSLECKITSKVIIAYEDRLKLADLLIKHKKIISYHQHGYFRKWRHYWAKYRTKKFAMDALLLDDSDAPILEISITDINAPAKKVIHEIDKVLKKIRSCGVISYKLVTLNWLEKKASYQLIAATGCENYAQGLMTKFSHQECYSDTSKRPKKSAGRTPKDSCSDKIPLLSNEEVPWSDEVSYPSKSTKNGD